LEESFTFEESYTMVNDKNPPEALLLFAMIAIIFGGTFLLNFIIFSIFLA
jgi:hypothetical protein|tara:strand:+ start:5791 stop:5940 length:150 start_codon:yes stop_codon:yes gene_type:complete